MAETGDGMYPNPVTSTLPGSSSHSTGSFGPVFAVLAVIVVISAVACVLGRICSNRRRRAKAPHTDAAAVTDPKIGKQDNGGVGPKEWQKPNFAMRDGDIEFGFAKKNPDPKKGGGANKSKPKNGGGRKPEVKFAENV